MNLDDQLRQAMAEHAAAVPEPPDRWAQIESRAAAARLGRIDPRHRARKRIGIAALGLAAATAAALIALPAVSREPARKVLITPGSHAATVVTPQSTPPTITGATTGTGAPGGSATTVPGAGSGYQPLYPFRNLQEAMAWQASYQATGAQPWHLDPGMTALSFTGFLGYRDVTTAFGIENDASGAHVTVGFPNPNGAPVNAAVVHLRRFGTAGDAPWEVVGTDDTTNFSLATPRYGATASSPLAVGGAIVGVDDNIGVQVLQLASQTPIGTFCCRPAGTGPWTATVDFHGATDKVLIVAASTGGHIATVERFTVTAVRTSKGTTPGL